MPNDAVKVVSNLREHLSRHDRPIAFLFGAGTSASVKISADVGRPPEPAVPAIIALTHKCKAAVSALGARFDQAWDEVSVDCREEGVGTNVEAILSRVRTARAAIGSRGRLHGLSRDDLDNVEVTICRTIGALANPDLTRFPAVSPHDRFAKWIGRVVRIAPIEIFTLNYDVLIERALERARIPVFDGFVGAYQPFFHGDSLRRSELGVGSAWTRLWKIHGSVSWRKVVEGTDTRIVRTQPSNDGEMILPAMSKYDESRMQPYLAYLDRLGRFLDQDDSLIVCCGYSFGDQHVNNVLFSALANRPRTHLVALQFEDVADGDTLATRGAAHRNLIVIGRTGGIVAATRDVWIADPPRCDSAGIGRQIIEPAPAAHPDRPQVMLGDFAVFSQFLESLVSPEVIA